MSVINVGKVCERQVTNPGKGFVTVVITNVNKDNVLYSSRFIVLLVVWTN